MVEAITELLKIFHNKGPADLLVFAALAAIFGTFYFLFSEYKSQKAEIKQLQDQRLEMAKEMLDLANKYNDQVQDLTRETNATITSLMTMIHLITSGGKQGDHR